MAPASSVLSTQVRCCHFPHVQWHLFFLPFPSFVHPSSAILQKAYSSVSPPEERELLAALNCRAAVSLPIITIAATTSVATVSLPHHHHRHHRHWHHLLICWICSSSVKIFFPLFFFSFPFSSVLTKHPQQQQQHQQCESIDCLLIHKCSSSLRVCLTHTHTHSLLADLYYYYFCQTDRLFFAVELDAKKRKKRWWWNVSLIHVISPFPLFIR